MKIKPEHLSALRNAIEPLDTDARRAKYRAGDFSNADRCKNLQLRYRWDLLYACGVLQGSAGVNWLPLYEYLSDDHIDTALRHIVKEL